MNHWNKAGIPHRGWLIQGCQDLEEASHVCDMCEQENIRYVHTMYHPEVDRYFAVGCVCAERMSLDYTTPAQQQREMRAQARWRQQGWTRPGIHEYQERWSRLPILGDTLTGIFHDGQDYRCHVDWRLCSPKFVTVRQAQDWLYQTYVL